MIVSPVARIEGRQVLLVAVDEVGGAAVVLDDALRALDLPLLELLCDLVEGDVGLIVPAVDACRALEPHGHEGQPRQRRRVRLARVERLGSRDVGLEDERRTVARDLVSKERLHRRLDHRAA